MRSGEVWGREAESGIEGGKQRGMRMAGRPCPYRLRPPLALLPGIVGDGHVLTDLVGRREHVLVP